MIFNAPASKFCQQKLGIFQGYLPKIMEVLERADFSQRDRLDKRFIILNQENDPIFPEIRVDKRIFFCVSEPLLNGEFTIFAAIKNPLNAPEFHKAQYALHKLKNTAAISNPLLIRSTKGGGYIISKLFNCGSLTNIINDPGYVRKALIIHLIAYKMICALNACHHCDIVHRDVKTSNFLVDEITRGNVEVRLTDFETSYDKNVDSESEATRFCGSPERISNQELQHYIQTGKLFPADALRDSWAFGSILYELATGKLPPEVMDVREASTLGIFKKEIIDLLYSNREERPSLTLIQERMLCILKSKFPQSRRVESLSVSEPASAVSSKWAKPREVDLREVELREVSAYKPKISVEIAFKKMGFFARIYRFFCCISTKKPFH
jgi:serine/threonine protein kinase